MSGRGGRGRGRGGCGRGGRGSGYRGRGSTYAGTGSSAKKGLCEALGENVFDCGSKGATDQMRTSWEKLTQYVGTSCGQDIHNELENKAAVTLQEPTHTPEVLARHANHEIVV